MKSFLLIISVIVLISHSSIAQYTNVQISYLYNPHETSIMINPSNPDIIVAGSNIFTANSLSGYYYSGNGGLNWSGGILTSNVAMPSGDNVIIVDTSGYFYYIQNSDWGFPAPPGFNKHLVQKSTDNGVTWSDGVTYGDTTKMQDKPWGCVDLSNSIYKNNIYITWTMFDKYNSYDPNDSSYIMFTRSTNGGISFSTPIRICEVAGNAIDSSNTVEGAVPCIGSNGEIYVSWAGPLGIVFEKSTDGGNTWLENDIFVTSQPGGWLFIIPGGGSGGIGLPITACDISGGSYDGTIYINWTDQRNGPDDTDVWMIKSTDGGNTWGQVKRVNDDPPGRHQFLTWMTVDQVTGYLYFVFYDRRNFTNYFTDVYLVRSTDAGETFENVKISESPFYPIPNPGYYVGDYINVSAHNNKVRPIWTRHHNYTSIWTAIIDTFYNVKIQKTSSKIPSSYELYQNYPNPFNPTTSIKFEIPKSLSVKLIVYDLLGKEVATLVNEKLNAGSYEVKWPAPSGDGSSYSSGVYFYRLVTGDFIDVKRMLLIK